MSGETYATTRQETAEILTSLVVTARKRRCGRPTIDTVIDPADPAAAPTALLEQDLDEIGMIETRTECRVWRPTIDAVPRRSTSVQRSPILH